jgi:DUF4097 and DUF4098 domain-containing protein YvlB
MKINITVMLLVLTTVAYSQTFTEKINKEFSFEKQSPDNAVIISNINGNVKVTGYDGDKVIIEIDKWVSGKTQARLDKGKQDLQLGVIDRADTLIFFIKDACNPFGYLQKGRKNNNGWNHNGWGYNWNCKDGNCNELSYDYKMDFTVRVPKNVHLMVSTINEGNVTVENVTGAVNANNINGSISLKSLTREVAASTINGDVDIEYVTNPKKECRFYSLNGDINAYFAKGLGAELSFESFNGEFYTNIDRIESLPVAIKKNESGQGLRYKINGNRYQVGSGGVFLDFETFNGNVYLKER